MPPTHDEIIERYGHRMVGIVLDLVLSGAKGTELSWRLKVARQLIRDELSLLYYDLNPALKPKPEPKPDVKPATPLPNGTQHANGRTNTTPNPPGPQAGRPTGPPVGEGKRAG